MTRSIRAGLWAACFVLLLLATAASARTTDPRPGPGPTTETLDCREGSNKTTCVECKGGGKIACCWDDDCDVIVDPPPQTRPTIPRLPSLPGTGLGELL